MLKKLVPTSFKVVAENEKGHGKDVRIVLVVLISSSMRHNHPGDVTLS